MEVSVWPMVSIATRLPWRWASVSSWLQRMRHRQFYTSMCHTWKSNNLKILKDFSVVVYVWVGPFQVFFSYLSNCGQLSNVYYCHNLIKPIFCKNLATSPLKKTDIEGILCHKEQSPCLNPGLLLWSLCSRHLTWKLSPWKQPQMDSTTSQLLLCEICITRQFYQQTQSINHSIQVQVVYFTKYPLLSYYPGLVLNWIMVTYIFN